MKPLLFSLLSLCLLSCGEKEATMGPDSLCPVQCSIVLMPLTFSDEYTPEDIDTVWVRKYKFGVFQSDTTYTLADTVRYNESGNTGIGFKGLGMLGDYEYEVQIKATGQLFKIRVILPVEYEYVPCSVRKSSCSVPVRDVILSGGEYKKLQYSHSPMYLQLQK